MEIKVNIPTLEDWTLVVFTAYRKDGNNHASLRGSIFGSAQSKDGQAIMTARIAFKDGNIVTTLTGKEFTLGKCAGTPDQEAAFNELINTLPPRPTRNVSTV
jgi:hypothetical protein